jgi:hypothetical protein
MIMRPVLIGNHGNALRNSHDFYCGDFAVSDVGKHRLTRTDWLSVYVHGARATKRPRPNFVPFRPKRSRSAHKRGMIGSARQESVSVARIPTDGR